MLSVLMTAFLSFSSVSGNVITEKPEPQSQNQISCCSAQDGYIPKPTISYGKYDIGWWREGLIGRHQMISIDSSEYIGELMLEPLTNTYNSSALTNFHFEETVETIETSTICTTVELSSTITTTLGVKMGMDDVSVSDDCKISKFYRIQNTQTYSYSKRKQSKVSFDVKEDVVKGKNFCLATVAYVYKVACQKWQYDDYWWGNYVVDGSRSAYYTYITLKPFITVGFEDGSFVG